MKLLDAWFTADLAGREDVLVLRATLHQFEPALRANPNPDSAFAVRD